MKLDRYGAIRNGEGKGIPKVTLPLGTIVIRKANKGGGKVRMIKIRMDGPTGLRWINYARWWWEENRGLVPPGKLVLHADGRTLNDKPENLVLGGPADKVLLAHRDLGRGIRYMLLEISGTDRCGTCDWPGPAR